MKRGSKSRSKVRVGARSSRGIAGVVDVLRADVEIHRAVLKEVVEALQLLTAAMEKFVSESRL